MLSSDYMYHKFTANDKYLKFSWDITKSSHNKRITALKIYQSTTPNGTYNFASTISYVRKSAVAVKLSGTNGDSGKRSAYIPALTTYSFDAGKDYRVIFDVDGTPQTEQIENHHHHDPHVEYQRTPEFGKSST